MDAASFMGVITAPTNLGLVASVVPALVAIRCGQLGIPARGLVFAQLLLAGWLVQSAAARIAGGGIPRFDAFAALLFAAATCLAIHRLEGVGPKRWRQLLGGSLLCVIAPPLLGLVPLADAALGEQITRWAYVAALGALTTGSLLALAPRMRRGPAPLLAQLTAWAVFGAPVLLAAVSMLAWPDPSFQALAALPSSLFLGWLLAPSSSPMRRAGLSIDPVLIVEGGLVVDANESAYALLAAPDGNLHALRNAIYGMAELRQMVVDENRECGEFFVGDGAATRQCIEVRVNRTEGANGEMRLLTLQNATTRKESERRLFHQAHFDSLTGLANRRYFVSRLGETIEKIDAKEEGRAVLMCLDLDRFKEINDTYGHAAGDELLRIMAHRLRQHLRLDDCLTSFKNIAPPSIARLGGDEFSIVLTGIESREDVERVATRVLKLVSEPVTLRGRKLWVAGSIGIAFYPDDGETLEELSSNADIALYHAKAERRSHYQFFDPSLTASNQRKAALDRQLRGAIEEGELSLHYQPKVAIDGEQIQGAEALLRWNSAEHGPVPPKEFIPVAEEFGLIGPIGTWVIDSACAQLAVWREAGLPVVPISVNVSPFQFREMNLLGVIGDALARHQIEPSLIEVELTESAVLEEGDAAIACLEQLRLIGVRIALDDFGTGYSALSYLSTVPLDVLKLDRKFIRDIHLDPTAEGVVSGVVAMARSLGLQVVAEGVDCQEQIESLRRADCDLIQGFVFGPGVPAHEFRDLLEWGLLGKAVAEGQDLQEDESEEIAAAAVAGAEVPAPEPSEAALPKEVATEPAIAGAVSSERAEPEDEAALVSAPLPAAVEEAAAVEEDDDGDRKEEELLPAMHGKPLKAPRATDLSEASEGWTRFEAEKSSTTEDEIDAALGAALAAEEDEEVAVEEVAVEEVAVEEVAVEEVRVEEVRVEEVRVEEVAVEEVAVEEVAVAAVGVETVAAAEAASDLPASVESGFKKPRPVPSREEVATTDEERRVLVVGGGDEGDLGLIALRLNRLGMLALYAHDSEEAQLFAMQEAGRVGVLVVSSKIAKASLTPLLKRVTSGENQCALVFVGGDPVKELLDFRGPGGQWVLREPIEDPELRFVFMSALTPLDRRAQRSWVRAPYDLLVHMEFAHSQETGVLTSLSEAGCFISCSGDPAPEGSLVDLTFTLEDGPVDVVGKVLYTQGEDDVGGEGLGIEFMGLTRELEERFAESISERASRCLA